MFFLWSSTDWLRTHPQLTGQLSLSPSFCFSIAAILFSVFLTFFMTRSRGFFTRVNLYLILVYSILLQLHVNLNLMYSWFIKFILVICMKGNDYDELRALIAQNAIARILVWHRKRWISGFQKAQFLPFRFTGMWGGCMEGYASWLKPDLYPHPEDGIPDSLRKTSNQA